MCAELRGEVFGCEHGGSETFGDDEGGDVVSEWWMRQEEARGIDRNCGACDA